MSETQSTRRLRWLLWMMLAWIGAIFGRLVWLQIVHHDDLLRQAQQQQQRTVEIQAMRGSILDRAGQPLAKSLPVESVNVNPSKIPDPGVAANILSRVLEIDRNSLYQRILTAKQRGSGFLWVKRKITTEEATRLRSIKLDWVEFRPEMRRFYPHGSLAAHVIGSTGMVGEDAAEQGNAGVELSFNDELGGQPGLAKVFTDVRQNPYESVISRNPEPGADLKLTIDAQLQYDAEKQLERAVASSHAKTGSIVAMNPYTGEILAMANYPTFDPNRPLSAGDSAEARSNLSIATPFEPGSVFKVITLSSALETTALRPDTMINCGNGVINLFGRVIHDHDSYSSLSMADVLAKSSNIGAIQIGLKVGDRRLYDYVRRFGFGRKTGIDLPGESSGLVRRVEQWTPSSIGSVAMGHEISTTALQLARAGAVVANGGLLVKPRLVLSRQKPGSVAELLPAEKPERVIAPETAIQMRQMMEGVVLHGTGKRAVLRGYTSGGKTGSAQIYDLKAHVYTHSYNASFLGFAPVANPQIVVAVTLNGTTGGSAGFGGPVAAPVFREVAMTALRMLDVPKDLPESLLRASTDPAVNEQDLAIAGLGDAPGVADSASRMSSTSGAQPKILARNSASVASFSSFPHDASKSVRDRSVSSVTQPPVRADSSASAAESGLDRRPFLSARATTRADGPENIAPGEHRVGLTGPKVPDFRGMTLRGVLQQSVATGLPVEVTGNGLARDQSPPPGAVLSPGVRVHVQFAR